MFRSSSFLSRTLATPALLFAALLASLAPAVAAPAHQGKTETANGALSGHWANDFGQNGANGTVNALVAANGNIYAGGGFTEIGGALANFVSAWNGHDWLAFGSGMNDQVRSLAVVGAKVYAAGSFTSAGGVPANHIAMWDGSSWHALGSGIDGFVYALAASGTDLYAAGAFTSAGGEPVNLIARWDGTSWHTLGSGLDSPASALLIKDGDLYVGGTFHSAGGVAVSSVARWDGSAWHDVGGGVNGGVSGGVGVLAAFDGDLYAGGYFFSAGGQPASGIVRWDGSAWHALPGPSSGSVLALAAASDSLYVGGTFDSIGGVETASLARWDGAAWHAIGEHGLQEQVVIALAVAPDGLYFGGNVSTTVGRNIGRWNGSSFDLPLIGGLDNLVTSLVGMGDTVYAAGPFYQAGYHYGSPALVAFDGVDWQPLLRNVEPAQVSLLAATDSTLYASGTFAALNNVPANHIAAWDGANWHALGSGITGTIDSMVVLGDNLVVGGHIDEAGGMQVRNIAMWDGTSWSALGAGSIDEVTALGVWNGSLYAATYSGYPDEAIRIMHWTGSARQTLPGAPDNVVTSIAGNASNLYVGGRFAHIGSMAANNVARWNGSAWSTLGSGITSSSASNPSAINALALAGDKVFVGGRFDRAGGAPASNIAVWNGSSWDAMEGGVSGYNNPLVMALTYLNGDLYVGGEFAFAGHTVSHRFAIWHDQPQFSDVTIGDYWYGPVRYLTTHGALSGYSTTPPCATAPCFNPFANTTRGQATKIIVAALGVPTVTPATPTFSDVPAASPFFAAVEGAVAAGVVSGYDGAAFCAPAATPCFRPNSDITRGQLAKIVVNAAGWKLIDPPSATFADVPVGSTFYRAIETAVQHGVISGYSSASGREFRPANSAIRAQLAKIVYQATR